VKSSNVRIPKNRKNSSFLSQLRDEELKGLTDLFYSKIKECNITLFSVVVDKDCLKDFFDTDKTTKKVYELLMERIENFLAHEHPKQNSIFIHDNTNKILNESIALKHSYFLRDKTSSGVKIKHILEMPFFVESYLSNGIQLADLCAYNVYRVFKANDEKYSFFQNTLKYFHSSIKTKDKKIDGLKVFPDDHRWKKLIENIETERARIVNDRQAL